MPLKVSRMEAGKEPLLSPEHGLAVVPGRAPHCRLENWLSSSLSTQPCRSGLSAPRQRAELTNIKADHVLAKSLQSCLTLCNPIDCSPPGSSVCGISPARIPEWVVMPSSRGSSRPRDRSRVSYVSSIGRQLPYH